MPSLSRDEQGQTYRVAGIAEEITEQVQAVQLLEQRVEERTHQLSTLLQIASSMTLTLELDPLLDMILDRPAATLLRTIAPSSMTWRTRSWLPWLIAGSAA